MDQVTDEQRSQGGRGQAKGDSHSRAGPQVAIAGYRLGDPIALEDVLSLPPDGRRYARDEQGRLTLMSPDKPDTHGHPLTILSRTLSRQLDLRWYVASQRAIGFEAVYDLHGRVLPDSRLGHKKIEPDLAVWDGTPVLREDPRGDSFSPERLVLVVELLSPGTWRNDLGHGRADDEVDRWRTYLHAGVPEYWLLNASPESRGLPPHSGLFLERREDGSWQSLAAEAARFSESRVGGFYPLLKGQIRSAALVGFTLDVGAFWDQATL